jgi:dolichyl-phosphate beta-glucosyltransferase
MAAQPQQSRAVQRTTIVIPCFNEAARLQGRTFVEFLPVRDDVAFCFVNDGSSDGTLDVLRELEERSPSRIRVVDLAHNSGKAEAVRQGFLASFGGADLLGYWDADLATPLSELPAFIDILRSGPQTQMVFGSRVKLLGRRIERRAARHYLGRIGATLISEALGLPIYDSQCGAKLFRSSPELREVFGTPFLSRWLFDVEILARYETFWGAAATAAAVYEFPLGEWREVRGSKVRPRDFVTAAADLWRIRRAYRLPRRP